MVLLFRCPVFRFPLCLSFFVECLRTLFHDRQLDKAGDGPGCGEAVATLIEFSNADIHTDPVLHDACSLDLSKFCREVPQGNSQQVTILGCQGVCGDLTKHA